MSAPFLDPQFLDDVDEALLDPRFLDDDDVVDDEEDAGDGEQEVCGCDGPHCLSCGCCEHNSCEEGCVWATPTLCSRCVS